MTRAVEYILQRGVELDPSILAFTPSLADYYTKTYNYFLSTILRLVRAVYKGRMGLEFILTMENLVSSQLGRAYKQAWKEEGTDEGFPDYLQADLDAKVAEQHTFISGYYHDIVDAKIREAPIDPLLSRAELWAQRFNEAYNNALSLIHLNNGEKEVWILGDTEHHCWICSSLNGIVAYASEWDELGVKPQHAPNEILSRTRGVEKGCGGWRCDCRREATDRRRSPNAKDRIQRIIGGDFL